MAIELISRASGIEATPIIIYPPGNQALEDLEPVEKNWAIQNKFSGKAGDCCFFPTGEGDLDRVVFIAPEEGTERAALAFGVLADKLPSGTYCFEQMTEDEGLAVLALYLHDYKFDRYKPSHADKEIRFILDDDSDRKEVAQMAEAHYLARDLINTPTNDMGTGALAQEIGAVAKEYGARFRQVIGDDLLKEKLPLIHAVGRASQDAPRLIDMIWGDEKNPKVTLVGKGVVFDTGGLNIKTGAGMTLMKKDMGGAANVLALAKMIMAANLPLRLRLLVPAVENAISGSAFRPGDILPSRAGLSVEITNTDAEGRLILADALALADEEAPEMLIDMATLTGAARVALGPDLPAFYTHDDAFADELQRNAQEMADPIWRLPLWSPYKSMLKSAVADINHAPAGGAGSITAALFLERFVKKAGIWVHFDIYGWTPNAKPARPKGGEAQAIRALYSVFRA